MIKLVLFYVTSLKVAETIDNVKRGLTVLAEGRGLRSFFYFTLLVDSVWPVEVVFGGKQTLTCPAYA